MRLVSTVFSIAVRGMREKRFYEEHLSSILRRNRPASRTVRAVLLRQRPAHSICFILVKRGAHNWMKVSETVAIRTLRPPGYMGKKNSGLLGTSARRQQQSKHGSLGGLLAVWACATHSVLDSTLLTSCKRPAQAVLRLAGLVAMVVGYVRQSNGYRHVDRLLKRFRLPPRQIRWFKCPDEESMQRARLTVRSAAASLAQKHGTFLFHWVMNRVHFCVGAPRRLADRRNAAQQSKLLPVSTLWNQGCAIEHYKRGFEVKKLPGNWAIVHREAGHIAEQHLEGEVKHWLQQQHLDGHTTQKCFKHLTRRNGGKRDWQPEAEKNYVNNMTEQQPDVLLQDDKDKKASWTLSFACFGAIFMSLVLLDPQWEATSLSLHQLSILVHGVSLFAIPTYMHKGPLPTGPLSSSDSNRRYRGGFFGLATQEDDAPLPPQSHDIEDSFRSLSLHQLRWQQVAYNPSSCRFGSDVWASWFVACSASFRCKGWFATIQERRNYNHCG